MDGNSVNQAQNAPGWVLMHDMRPRLHAPCYALFTVLLAGPLSAGQVQLYAKQNTKNEIHLRATVQDVVPLAEYSGKITSVDFDPRFALVTRVESVNPAISSFTPGVVVAFAIHSPALLFGGAPSKGNIYDFSLQREIEQGKTRFFGLEVEQARTATAKSGPSKRVILSATDTVHGIGGKEVQLVVLLTEEGKVEWDQFVNNSVERKTTTIPAEQLSEIKRNLSLVKASELRSQMGPYNTYTDTWVELRIRTMTMAGRFTFTVLNPWVCELPSCSQGRKRPMPADVQAVVCEVSKLRSTVAKEPVYLKCEKTE